MDASETLPVVDALTVVVPEEPEDEVDEYWESGDERPHGLVVYDGH